MRLKSVVLSVGIWGLILTGPVLAGSLYIMGQHSDMTTNNPWAYWGPKAEVWNGYPTAGIYPAVYSVVPPTWQFVPALAKHMFGVQDFKTIPLEEVFPEGIPEGREKDFTVKEEPVKELFYVDIKLYDYAKWSDGTPITAYDVAFTHNITLQLNPIALGGNHPSFTPPDVVAKVEALDDYTVRYYLIRKDARFMFGALTRPIVSKRYWKPIIDRCLQSENPLETLFAYEDTLDEPSAGPFLRGKWEKGAFIHRKANPDYSFRGFITRLYTDGTVHFIHEEYGIDEMYYGEGKGEVWLEEVTGPYVDEILYNIYMDQASAVLAVRKGDVHFTLNPGGLEVGFQEQLKGVPGVELTSNPTYGIRYMAFNLRRSPFNDIAFRKAFATLIDREFICEKVLQGVAFPLATVMPPGNAAWHNPDVPVYGKGLNRVERVKEAVSILKEAGYSWEVEPQVDVERNEVTRRGRGLKMPDGSLVEEFELLAPGPGYDPLRATFAIWIERWANEVGIPVRVRLTDFSLIVDRVFTKQDFDAWMLGWSLGSPAFPTFFNAFFHSRYSEPGGFNAQGYSNPEYDALVEKFLATLDIEEAREVAFRLQEILAKDLPYIVLFDTEIVEAYRRDRVKYPFTKVLGGIQFLDGMPSSVHLID